LNPHTLTPTYPIGVFRGLGGSSGGYDTPCEERVGAATLVSIIDGAVQAAANAERGRGSGDNVVVDPQGSRDVLTEAMRKTISIPPTITVNQGSPVAVIVARNVDCRSVYALRVANRTQCCGTVPRLGSFSRQCGRCWIGMK
jgi:type IV secretion system protein VirB10